MVERSLSREIEISKVRIHWPPRSPDINNLHFYLWGYMKDEIRRKKMHAKISQMKEQVKEIIVSIPVEILRRVIGKLNRCIQTLL